MSGQKPREIAARILHRRSGENADYVENLLEKALGPARLSAADRGLCQELAYGVVRWQSALDWLITRKTGNRAQKPMLQTLLRLGLYQIFWLDRIPNHAAVHETVEQAKQSGFGPQAGFVNAVLRGYLREFDATKNALAELKATQPAIGYSHPEWLVARWQKRWGPENAARLMEWNNTPPKTFARVNALRLGRRDEFHESPIHAGKSGTRGTRPTEKELKNAGDVLTQWRDEDVEYDFVRRDWLEENLVFELKSHPPLATLPSFQQGLFYVQDPSTLLAVRELNPQPGETVLDLCAAPGGKLTYIAQLMQNQGALVAHDTSPDRLKLIEENCARLGVTCVQTRNAERGTRNIGLGEAATLVEIPSSEFSVPSFDRILVDAPCSNTGVMSRRVDLRWRIRPEEIDRLRIVQLDLLRQAAAVLKPGGTLIYSTCSLEPEENESVADEFLRTTPGFKLENRRELLPFVDAVDGAFVARFARD